MTWTYTADPANVPVDSVRLLIGDTNTIDQMIQDEEISYVLTQYPAEANKPPWLAAASVCDAIAARFGRAVQQSIGALSQAAQQQYDHYMALADHFRLLFNSGGLATSGPIAGVPLLGGTGTRTKLGGTWVDNEYDGYGV